MIDLGLLASIAVMVIITTVFVQPWPPAAADGGLIDSTSAALLVGLGLGRRFSVALDDPNSLTQLNDLLVIRSGVEFWPGLAAGMAVIGHQARREGVGAAARLAAISSPGLVAWGAFELTCLIRDGCPGPLTTLGLRPRGLSEPVFPVEVLAAMVAFTAAAVLRRAHRNGRCDLQVVLIAVTSLAVIKSVASVWLPHVGDGLTRQHETSIVVAGVAAGSYAVARWRAHSHQRPGVTQ